MSWLATVAFRLVVCSAITAVAYRALGPVALALCAPLFGIALARPIMDALGQLPRLARQAKYRGFEGKYYEFKGRQIVVHEDPDRYRWVELDAVRKIALELPGDTRLARLHAEAFEPATQDRVALLRADELVSQLGQLRQPEAIRLRNWLEREIVVPSTKVRTRGRYLRQHKVNENESAP